MVGDDAVVSIVDDQIALVENVDIFTPIHDDPLIQGKIIACNATNDVFAMGATKILSLQAFLGYPKEMPEEIAIDILRGMSMFMSNLDSRVTGGQTIRNPCPVFGGICLGITHPSNIVYSSGAKPGDIAILTKPLGIQPAMRSYRDLKDEKRDSLLKNFNEAELVKMQEIAVKIMTTSNLEVAKAMNEIGVHAATDITGFGLLGHASNIATLSDVDITIDSLPAISGTLELAEFFGHKLKQGWGAETAGGMLILLPPNKVDAFMAKLESYGLSSWIVGQASKSADISSAKLADDVQYIETEFR